jgi:hypothetical protein
LADKPLFSLVIFVRGTMEIVPHYEAFLTLQVFYYPITDVEDRARGHAWELVQFEGNCSDASLLPVPSSGSVSDSPRYFPVSVFAVLLPHCVAT